MEAFLRSNKAIWLMLFADLLVVAGGLIVQANGGIDGMIACFALAGLLGWNALFFRAISRSNAKS